MFIQTNFFFLENQLYCFGLLFSPDEAEIFLYQMFHSEKLHDLTAQLSSE